MKINENIYPYNTDVKSLPFYLTGLGGSEYQPHIVRNDGYEWHQILYSASGSGVLKFDDRTEKIGKGDFFFLPANYPHEYYPEAPAWEVRWVSFDGCSCEQVLKQFGMTKPMVMRPQESSTIRSVFDRMYTSQKADRILSGYTCSGLVYEYIIEFYRMTDTTENKLRQERGKLLTPALNYIDENFRSDFPLTIPAEVAGVTPQHLCRVFKSVMNMRPNEYLTERRLQEAKSLLRDSKLTISEVCIQSGFSDTGYFSTVFKKHEGLTPTEYRKRMSVI